LHHYATANEAIARRVGRVLTDIEQQLGDPQVNGQLAKIPSSQIPRGVPPANLRETQRRSFQICSFWIPPNRIVAGSDAGNIGTLRPALHREFELMARPECAADSGCRDEECGCGHGRKRTWVRW
jgi:hypothetical protein